MAYMYLFYLKISLCILNPYNCTWNKMVNFNVEEEIDDKYGVAVVFHDDEEEVSIVNKSIDSY